MFIDNVIEILWNLKKTKAMIHIQVFSVFFYLIRNKINIDVNDKIKNAECSPNKTKTLFEVLRSTHSFYTMFG